MLDDIRFIATTVSLAAAALCGVFFWLRSKNPGLHINTPIAILFLVIFIPSFIQVFLWNDLYLYLNRDAALIADGQLWRLITPVMVQSGNVSGLAFNFACFLILVPLAAKILGTRLTLVLFFVGAAAGEVAGLFWLPVGGGNSVGNYGVAAGLLAYAAMYGNLSLRVLAVSASVVTIMALSLMDIHSASYAAALLAALGYFYAEGRRKRMPVLRRRYHRSGARA